MKDTDLSGADLRNAALTGANLLGAKWEMVPRCEGLLVDPLPEPSFGKKQEAKGSMKSFFVKFFRSCVFGEDDEDSDVDEDEEDENDSEDEKEDTENKDDEAKKEDQDSAVPV